MTLRELSNMLTDTLANQEFMLQVLRKSVPWAAEEPCTPATKLDAVDVGMFMDTLRSDEVRLLTGEVLT